MKNPKISAAAMAAILATLPASVAARGVPTFDAATGLMTFDQAVIDSSGAFLVGQLENLDPTLHEPLYAYTWSRDIQVRPGLAMADDFSSWTASTYAAASGSGASRKNFVAKNATEIVTPQLDIGKYTNPLTPWAMEPAWSVFELEAAQRLGQPIDVQLYNAMRMKWNMDTDEMVYIGDTGLGVTGLVNNALVTNVANSITLAWATGPKTPDQILASINELLVSVWTASGYAVMPNKIGLPPAQYAQLTSTIVSSAGNMSVLSYLLANNIATTTNGMALEIVPMKWLTTAGVSNVARMIAYTDDMERVRYAMVPLQRTALQFQGIHQKVAYYGKLGGVEVIYPETIGYRDGI